MKNSPNKTQLNQIEPGMTMKQIYELYLARPMFIETEIVNDKADILGYLAGIRDIVADEFADHFDDIWNSIIDDDSLGAALWKYRKTSKTPFNRYTIYKIIGILENNGFFKSGYSLRQISRKLETGTWAETARTYMSQGLEKEKRRRLRSILKVFGVCSF